MLVCARVFVYTCIGICACAMCLCVHLNNCVMFAYVPSHVCVNVRVRMSVFVHMYVGVSISACAFVSLFL